MAKPTLSLKFFPKPNCATLPSEYVIYYRIRLNRQKIEFSTKERINDLSEWDALSERVVSPKSTINFELNRIETEVMELFNKLKYTNGSVSTSDIKIALTNKVDTSPVFLSFLKEELDHILKDSQLSTNTKKNYQATYNHIEAFLTHIKRPRILVKDINDRFVKDFDNYLMNKRINPFSPPTLCRTTVNKYQIKFKRMMNAALDQKLLKESPFKKIKFKEVPSTRTFLTQHELDAIERHNLNGNVSLQRVRDIFLFSVYTGLRFSDASALKKENLEFDGTNRWLVFRQQKTQEFTRLPLLSKAYKICEKYINPIHDHILPRISNQKVNLYLKAIASLAGISKKITHHVARHTNATTVFLSNGVSLEIVNKQLGHKSIRTTQIYAKITNELLLKETNKLDKILNMKS